MSQKKFASPLRLTIIPSHYLLIVVSLLHVGGMTIIWFTSLPWWIKVMISVAVAASMIWFVASNYCRKVSELLKKHYPHVRELIWGNDDEWLVVNEVGEELKARFSTASFVHPQFTVVSLKIPELPWYSRSRSFIFLKDNIDPETFRRLRIRLQWYSAPDPDNSVVLK